MINKKWDVILKDEFNKEYFKELGEKVKEEYRTKICYPEYKNIFNAFRYTDYDEVKVVIIGQDPYHGEGEAHGLCFSVLEGVPYPPSLRNIFKELNSDLGVERHSSDLTGWAKQGVLLLNSIMSVVKDTPLSHKDLSWTTFTDNVIRMLDKREKPIIFVLWGSYARSKKELINSPQHKIIECVHPSPLSASRGFFGSKPFSTINRYLEEFGVEPIDFSK